MVILENDQICFRESENAENDYKVGLAKAQKAHTDKIFDILKNDFGITMKIFHTIQLEDQDPSIKKIGDILAKLDQYVISSLYSVATSSKSTAIALAFILKDELSI